MYAIDCPGNRYGRFKGRLFHSLLAQPKRQAICLPFGLCKGNVNGFWKTTAIPSSHVSPECTATRGNPNLYADQPIINIISTDSPTATRLGLCSSLSQGRAAGSCRITQGHYSKCRWSWYANPNDNWKPKVVITPSLSSLVSSRLVVVTTEIVFRVLSWCQLFSCYRRFVAPVTMKLALWWPSVFSVCHMQNHYFQ